MSSKFNTRPIILGTIFVTVFLIISSLAIWTLARHEKNRDIKNSWVNLGVKADTRSNAINNWLNSRLAFVMELANNPSLNLYSQQLLTDSSSSPESGKAQLSYLRSLLNKTAERNGFMSENPVADIKANVPFSAVNGLAVLGAADKRILAATPGFNYSSDDIDPVFMNALDSGSPQFFESILKQKNTPIIGFMVPFYGLQKHKHNNQALGVIFAYTSPSPLFTIIKDKVSGSTEETVIVRLNGEKITYISPLADGTPAMTRHLPTAADPAAAAAAAHPGISDKLSDYTGNSVLFTSRAIDLTPWVLIEKINENEASKESDAHRKSLIISLILASLLAASLMAGAWIQGNRVQEMASALELQSKTNQLESKNLLLDAINNNISDLLLMIDKNNQCIFINKHFADKLGSASKELEGKTLTGILGNISADIIKDFALKSLTENKPQAKTISLEINNKEHLLHSIFTPVAYKSKENDTVLVAMHDMTEIQQARQKEADLLNKLIKSLMQAIDRHDPYSANHSSKTSCIAVAIGKNMNISAEQLKTIEIASNLCNLGKLSIPKEVLTKTDKLSDDELNEIRQESKYAWDMLQDIAFEGPVKETIVQKHEHIDGSGHPEGLSGQEIIDTARILAVANAFVAMISPRAYRERLSSREAMDKLMKYSGSRYDRKVLAALFHIVENEINWQLWENS